MLALGLCCRSAGEAVPRRICWPRTLAAAQVKTLTESNSRSKTKINIGSISATAVDTRV
jgi:hypothetical protein